jgi:sarcosine oxidase subunit beta
METADVVIVGAGVIGASTAFHLAQAGVRSVIVVERRHIGAGATGKSGALVRTHYTNEPETRLAFESLRYFQHWRELVGGDCGFRPVGLLVFVPAEYLDHLRANVAMHRSVGVNTSVITAEEARELDPSLYVGDVTHVAYEPESGYADPNGTAYGFMRAATARGVRLWLDTEVTGVTTVGPRVTGVTTSRGPIASPAVIIAAGAWANSLFARLGIDLGLVPVLGRIAIFRWAYERSERHLTYIDHVNRTWARPIDGNCTLIGVHDPRGEPEGDPDRFSQAVTPDYIELCRQKLVARFPVMQHSSVRGNWQCIMMRSPDSRPLIGRLPQYDGLYCMAGDSGTSFKTAPAIGKCLAELVTVGKAETMDLYPFRPTRVAEGKLWQDRHDYGLDRATIGR